MNLLTKYNRVLLPVTMTVLLIGSIGFYFIVRTVLVHQLDKDLVVEEVEINNYAEKFHTLPASSNFPDQEIIFEPVLNGRPSRAFDNYRKPKPKSGEYDLYRRLVFPVEASGKLFKVSVLKSQAASQNILQLIAVVTVILLVFLFGAFYFANRFILANIWKPFYDSLARLKKIDVNAEQENIFPATTITEFSQLNDSANKMLDRLRQDFQSLKSFTENASHEIQTPLSAIRMKAELLMQSANLEEQDFQNLHDIEVHVDRLSKLNQALLLLTRLDNRQFGDDEIVDIAAMVSKQLENLQELSVARSCEINSQLQERCDVTMSKSLAETLIVNLLSNALKHSTQGCNIEVRLQACVLSVINKGDAPALPPKLYFERFRKSTNSKDSLGLGLAIVKKICDTYGFEPAYLYEEGEHIVTIDFHP